MILNMVVRWLTCIQLKESPIIYTYVACGNVFLILNTKHLFIHSLKWISMKLNFTFSAKLYYVEFLFPITWNDYLDAAYFK